MFSTAVMDAMPVYVRIKKVGVHGNSKNCSIKQLGEQFKVGKLAGFGTVVPFSLLNGTKYNGQ